MTNNEMISCSVGILTHNSEKNLRRALESVKNFSDIIIADGGSTDQTLQIASEYGCTVIEQYSKRNPGPKSFHPITDFSAERNNLLQAAKTKWFLYIDSDEYISEELLAEITEIVTKSETANLVYEIPIGNQSPDANISYRPWKQNYQTRFFSTDVEGEFQKVMHERFVFDREKYPVGRLEGKWYVPFSKPDFASYSRTVNYRLRIMLSEKPPKNFFQYLEQGFYLPVKRVAGATYRHLMMGIFYPRKLVLPLWQYRNVCYSQWVTFKIASQLYWLQFSKNEKNTRQNS